MKLVPLHTTGSTDAVMQHDGYFDAIGQNELKSVVTLQIKFIWNTFKNFIWCNIMDIRLWQ